MPDVVQAADCDRPRGFREVRSLPPGFPGTHDPTFHPLEASDSEEYAVFDARLQPDGKLLVMGSFVVEQEWRSGLVRLHPDGRLDHAFAGRMTQFQTRPNFGIPSMMALQSDGRILLTSPDWFGRLHEDGSVDPGFSSPFLPDEELKRRNGDGSIFAISIQADHRILLGGKFRSVGGLLLAGLVRLNPDGTVDRTFVPDPLFVRENISVGRILLHSDGRILLLTDVGFIGLTREGLCEKARINLNERGGLVSPAALTASGHLLVSAPGYRSRLERWDSNFRTDLHVDIGSIGECSEIDAILELPDGRIMVGGRFSRIGTAARYGMARFHPDGGLDLSFDASVADRRFEESFSVGGVAGFVVDHKSSVLVFGSFTHINGDGPGSLARLNNGEWSGIAPRSTQMQPDGAVQFKLTGPVGQSVVIEATATLEPPVWRAIATNTIAGGDTVFTVDGTKSSQQYYRAVTQ